MVCDLIGIGKALACRIHSSIEERSGIPANQIMVCCTHTHTGPLTEPWKAAGLFPDEVYLEQVVEMLEQTENSQAKPGYSSA